MVAISEVVGIKDDRIEVQDIFVFERTGVTDAGKVQGRFRATGVKPRVLDRLRVSGLQLPDSVFNESLDVNL
jgi:pilus assembly protein CpaF